MGDIEGTPVARLPHEELEQIQLKDGDRDEHGVGDVAELVVLLQRANQADRCPAHHGNRAVGPGLEVKRANPRVKLRAPVEVKEQASSGARIGARREVETLEGQKHAKEDCKHGESGENLAVVRDHVRRVDQAKLPARKKEGHRSEVALNAVCLVHGHIALWRDRAPEFLAWHYDLQDGLDDKVAEHVFHGDRIKRRGHGGKEVLGDLHGTTKFACIVKVVVERDQRTVALEQEEREQVREGRRGQDDKDGADDGDDLAEPAAEAPNALAVAGAVRVGPRALLAGRQVPAGGGAIRVRAVLRARRLVCRGRLAAHSRRRATRDLGLRRHGSESFPNRCLNRDLSHQP